MSFSPAARPDLPPPLFVGDHPAVDFLNSRAVPDGVAIDWIGDGQGLLAWLDAADLLPSPGAGSDWARMPADELDAAAAAARQLREWLRRFLAGRDRRPDIADMAADLAPLNRLLRQDASYRQLTIRDGRIVWSGPLRATLPQALLQPIAGAIGDLLCRTDPERLRPCEGIGCSLMFLDRTKSGRRRWCSMAVCGNRAKVAAHRNRLRAEDIRTDATGRDDRRQDDRRQDDQY